MSLLGRQPSSESLTCSVRMASGMLLYTHECRLIFQHMRIHANLLCCTNTFHFAHSRSRT